MSDNEKPTLDETINAAYDKLSGVEPDADEADVTDPLEAKADVPAGDTHTTAEVVDKAVKPISPETQRARDEKGRFNKAEQAAAKARGLDKSGKPPTTGTPPAVSDGKELKPPSSLSPQAREAWASVPKEVQADIWRREKETMQAVQGAAEARQHQQWYQQAVAPYEGAFRAEGVDSRTGISNLLQVMAVLQGPNPVAKAQLWATVARTYGLDPDLVTNAYNGTMQGQPQQQHQQMDPRAISQQAGQWALDQLNQQRQAVIVERAEAEVEQHAPQLEFFNDLRPAMSAIMDAFTAQKQPMDIPTAYKLALSQRQDLQDILSQRQAAQSVRQPNNAVARARAAGSSIRGTPSPPAPQRDRKPGLDGAVDAAYEAVARRQGIL